MRGLDDLNKVRAVPEVSLDTCFVAVPELLKTSVSNQVEKVTNLTGALGECAMLGRAGSSGTRCHRYPIRRATEFADGYPIVSVPEQ
jgi:hypothetical protein